MSRHAVRGFTIVELMMTVAILAILTMLAVPGLRGMLQQQRVKTASFDIYAGLILARSEAIKRNATVILTPAGGNWAGGWTTTLTSDLNTPIARQDPFSGVTIAGPGTVTFNGMGRLSGAATSFSVSSTGIDASKYRCVTLDLSGRPVTKEGACS